MIKANELRIGNYLSIYGSPAPIQVGWFCLIAQKKELPSHEPIPLTEEILQKAGFKGPNEYGYFEGAFFIKKEQEGWIIDDANTWNNLTTINYLHQLQNLHFALTGEELKIEL